MRKILVLVLILFAATVCASEKSTLEVEEAIGFDAIFISSEAEIISFRVLIGDEIYNYSAEEVVSGVVHEREKAMKEGYLLHHKMDDVDRIEAIAQDQERIVWWGKENNVVDGKFLTLSAAVVVASIFDVESTFYTLGRCPTCYEANPLMRPFVNRGRGATYALQAGVSAAVIYMAYRFKRNNSKAWWLVPTLHVGAHSFAGAHNIGIAWNYQF